MKAIDSCLPVKQITCSIKILMCVALVVTFISFYLSSCTFPKSEKVSGSLCVKDNDFNLWKDCPDQHFRKDLHLCNKGSHLH